jgi:hypothetical protein
MEEQKLRVSRNKALRNANELVREEVSGKRNQLRNTGFINYSIQTKHLARVGINLTLQFGCSCFKLRSTDRLQCTEDFSSFSWSLQVKAWIVYRIKLVRLPSISFPDHYSPLTYNSTIYQSH